MTQQRESFVFYRSFKESISELSDSDKLIMYEAISDYALNMAEPLLTGFPKMLFTLIRPQLDANIKRWANGCKGKEHGGKGGAPKGNKNAAKTTPKQPLINPKTTPNVNENDNVNENVLLKEKQKKKSSQPMTPEEQDFHEKMKERFHNVMGMKEPLSLEQYHKLLSEFGKDVVVAKLEAMENYAPLRKNNLSANKTIRNWIRRESAK